MLEVHNINTFYGEAQALHDVSLRVDEGELVVCLGANGHGKSTLLKTICGLITPASGSIKYRGEEISKLPPQILVEMGIVYIAQDRHLFPYMTVLENLKLGAYNIRAQPKAAENLEYVFQLFPRLKERKNQRAGTLSGGEGRMVAIGRGLMASAEFLAIDEPSLGLSPALESEVFSRIYDINKKGITILLVEQDVTKALEHAERGYLVEHGKIVFEGSKEQILSDEHVKAAYLGI
ncbi:MAG: ABC transporter ATP-binding protein [Dehalococcoidia bacterium]|nr:MAG: ABC transporter ATP-binding protein [Dehalococcoidia bacterium]